MDFHELYRHIDSMQTYSRRIFPVKSTAAIKQHSASHAILKKNVGEVHWIQRPQPAAIEALDEHFQSGRDYVNRVDFAFDIPTETMEEAEAGVDFCRRHLVHKFSREMSTGCGVGHYAKRRRWGTSNTAAYSRISKVANTPCLHLEVRIMGAEKLKAIGITRPCDVFGFDYGKLWQRTWTFREFTDNDVVAAARQVSPSNPKRTAALMRRAAACDEDGTLSAQNWGVLINRLGLRSEHFLRSRTCIYIPIFQSHTPQAVTSKNTEDEAMQH